MTTIDDESIEFFGNRKDIINTGHWTESSDPFLHDWYRAREVIKHEDMLINQRMTWLILINGFLIASYFGSGLHVIGTNGLPLGITPEHESVLSWLFPALGISTGYTILITLRAANRSINDVVDWWTLRLKSDPRQGYAYSGSTPISRHTPLICGENERSWFHDAIIAKAMTPILIVFWFWIWLEIWGLALTIVLLIIDALYVKHQTG